MAIGIDRGMHKRLIDGLALLIKTNEDQYWMDVLLSLQIAYDDANNQLCIAEACAALYNELQITVRSQVANELRVRKRKGKSVQQ